LGYKQRNISNNPKKSQKMKKVLAIALIAATFAACNNGDKKVDETKTSDTTTVVTKDTATVINDTTVKTTITTDTLNHK
jgi:hypothetical protein